MRHISPCLPFVCVQVPFLVLRAIPPVINAASFHELVRIVTRVVQTEYVVEINRDGVHGIARSSSHMESLETYLHHQGFDVINLDYPSTKHDLQTLIQGVHEDLSTRLVLDKPTHFVGYSMGGLLVRAIAHKYPPQNRARVVQLAPPNHGSEVADFIQNNWL